MFNKSIFVLPVALVLSACGGGSAGDGGTVTPASTVTISGKVLDDNVANARVCFDVDNDKQCTQSDSFVTTQADGSYELTVTETVMESSLLIADVRYLDATDAGYTNSQPDYDYVMTGFDISSSGDNIISPMSTYLNIRQAKDGTTANQTRFNTAYEIVTQETYSSEVSTSSIDFSQYITSDFTAANPGEDPALTDFRKRLLGINQVLAREMQESQAYWEDAFYNGSYTPASIDWNANSLEIIENSQLNVFESYEVILEQVMVEDFRTFDADLVAATLAPAAPTGSQLSDLFNYAGVLKQVQTDSLSGSTYYYTSYLDSGNVDNYIHFSDNALTIYVAFSDGSCYESSVPGFFADLPEQQFVDAFNQSLQQQSAVGLTSSSLVKVSAAPANCSSFDSLIAGAGISTSISATPPAAAPSTSEMYQPVYPTIKTSAVLVSPYKKSSPPSLSGGSLSGATLSSCGVGANKYSISPCRTPGNKN